MSSFSWADDNGSGAALAVEIARVLNDENFPYSVKIALVPEYLGSVPYALQLKSENNLPIYTINLDMVGADQNKTGSTFILSKVPPYLPQRWGISWNSISRLLCLQMPVIL